MYKILGLIVLVATTVSGQTLRACTTVDLTRLCNTLDNQNSDIACSYVDSNIDCALRLARNEVDFGIFSEEELLLIAQRQQNENRVIGTIRNDRRTDSFAFEAVAVVPASFTGGLQGLQGANYCHPGFDQREQRWSPRVLKTLEQQAAGTNRCPEANTNHKTAEELEVETLSRFFAAACRPGQWSPNATVDANLKRQYPNLCSLCGPNSDCNSYTIDMGVSVAGVDNTNRHIQALECMRTGANTNRTVAYVAWQHVVEFFTNRNTDQTSNFAILCPDGSTQTLTPEILTSPTAPCSFVKQPWKAIIASTNSAQSVSSNFRSWWPQGRSTGSGWQTTFFGGLIGGNDEIIVFEDTLPTPANYTAAIRTIPPIDSTTTCIPSRRWCVLSTEELNKCNWAQAAAHSLGIQPSISCIMRSSVFLCMQDINQGQVDFIAIRANYGYLARQHFNLSAVKLVQNTRTNVNSTSRVAAFIKNSAANEITRFENLHFNLSAVKLVQNTRTNVNSTSRVAAFIKNSAANEITRFENLRDKRACFPEYGGLAFVAFVKAAHDRSVISPNQCDYARAVGEFFNSACAPGAIDAAHVITQTTYDATKLCTACRPAAWYRPLNTSETFCAWDYRNQYFGNNGSLACLSDPSNDVAVLQIGRINSYLTQTGLQANQFRALCRNNTLAASPGVDVDDNCLLAHVVDTEIVARRNDVLNNALNVLLDHLERQFGYAISAPLINFEIFSPFDGVSDLLFRDSVIGLAEPSSTNENEIASNYFQLFEHLEKCNAAPPTPGQASRTLFSIVTLVIMSFMARVVMY